MHLQGEIGSLANDNTTKMSGGAVDVRLRRQNPVSIKPPRLRLGARPASSHQHQSRRQQQHKTASWSSGIEATTQEPNGNPVGDSVGITELTYNANENRKGSPSHSGGSSNRPLIHHQRHNLKTRFQLLKTLGEGTYGKVKLAADKATGEHVAIKYIKKTKIQDENDLVRIRREIQILSNLRHQHIVNIREVFEKKDKIVLVMDYAQGGELYDYLNKMGKLSEWEARRIFRQIVSAIHYCHQNNIVHRDLKLENIILDDEGNVKIADFGLSNYYSHNSTLKTFCGSPLYASPEIVNGKPYHGPEVDVWSLGVILYTLVYGAMPFESNSLVSLKQQISDGDYNQPSKPSDAAGLIRHMLTVTPSRRATIEDALRHWWINFGHNNMPNGMRYSPDDEPPIMQYTLTAESTSLDPPVIIHHRNQSSISSDSDVELDFRPLRWTKRSMTLDSTGNSVSSSIAGSPAPLSDGCNNTADHTDDCDDDPAVVAAGLQKLPPDVLEILKGCSSRSLAALLNTDKISTGFDLDPSDSSSNPTCQTAEEQNREETVESEKSSTSVFDSERKPKRGILKRKGKFSGGDSGCVMPEEMTAHSEDNPIPKSGHLPRRLPSFRDEAHGIFASKHRASQLLDNASGTLQHESCNSAISHAAWCYTPPHSRRQQHHHHQQHSHHSETPHHTHTQAMQPHNSCLTNPNHTTASDFINDNVPTSLAISDDNSGIPTAPRSPKEEPCHPDSASSASSCDIVVSKDPAKVVHRPKSILKNSKLNEARNRLSVSSIGSNSSADILDLSYDSGDSDHFVNQALSLSPDDGGLLIDSVQALDQNCANDSQVISGNPSGLSYNSHQAAFSDDSAEILDSKSSMLYRLTRDAQTLL